MNQLVNLVEDSDAVNLKVGQTVLLLIWCNCLSHTRLFVNEVALNVFLVHVGARFTGAMFHDCAIPYVLIVRITVAGFMANAWTPDRAFGATSHDVSDVLLCPFQNVNAGVILNWLRIRLDLGNLLTDFEHLTSQERILLLRLGRVFWYLFSCFEDLVGKRESNRHLIEISHVLGKCLVAFKGVNEMRVGWIIWVLSLPHAIIIEKHGFGYLDFSCFDVL